MAKGIYDEAYLGALKVMRTIEHDIPEQVYEYFDNCITDAYNSVDEAMANIKEFISQETKDEIAELANTSYGPDPTVPNP